MAGNLHFFYPKQKQAAQKDKGWKKGNAKDLATKQHAEKWAKEKAERDKVRTIARPTDAREVDAGSEKANRQIKAHRRISGAVLVKLEAFVTQIGKYQAYFPTDEEFTADFKAAFKTAGDAIQNQARIFRDAATALAKLVEVERLAYGIVETPALQIDRVIVIPLTAGPTDWDQAAHQHFTSVSAEITTTSNSVDNSTPPDRGDVKFGTTSTDIPQPQRVTDKP